MFTVNKEPFITLCQLDFDVNVTEFILSNTSSSKTNVPTVLLWDHMVMETTDKTLTVPRALVYLMIPAHLMYRIEGTFRVKPVSMSSELNGVEYKCAIICIHYLKNHNLLRS